MPDTRKYARFSLTVPVIFTWRDQRSQWRRSTGLTRDLSAAGVYLYSAKVPPVGVPIEFAAILPPLEPTLPALRLHGEARVMRVEKVTGKAAGNGFAVKNKEFVLQELD